MEKMFDNFGLLEERVLNSLELSDLEKIRYDLSKIGDPILTCGVGGSSVVSKMSSKIISKKNKIIATDVEFRDFNYDGFYGYKNVLVSSYGGLNHGVDVAFNNDLNKYLLSSRKREGVCSLLYKDGLDIERSFISLGATIVPVSILMNYYLDGNNSIIEDLITRDIPGINIFDSYYENLFEIFSGYDTSVSARYLESTIVEAGLGVGVVHDKYAYCHGRSTMGKNYDSTVIYLDSGKELDELLIEKLCEYHERIFVLRSTYEDDIVKDYDLLLQSMYLTRDIASFKKVDLSSVDYSPVVKKVYRFNGEM